MKLLTQNLQDGLTTKFIICLQRDDARGRGGWHDPEQCTTKSLATLAQAHVNRGKEQYIDAAILYLMAAWREEQSEKK